MHRSTARGDCATPSRPVQRSCYEHTVSEARFAFAICNPGSEPWLVREVARLAPSAAPSYRRKGLLTFKLGNESEDALEASVFARVSGRSLGLARDAAAVRASFDPSQPMRLHVYPRDASDDSPSRERAASIEAELRAHSGFLEGAIAEPGDHVLDVIVAGDEPLVVGARVQREHGWRTPGGRVAIAVPDDAPSRAFAKLEEALAWSRLALPRGATAIELGSAPGGAAYALARRGVHVLGIDPATMDPRVLAYEGPGGARVRHLALAAGALRKKDVPSYASILVCDANLAPPVALRTVASIASWLRESLTTMILTLKMNDEHMVDAIPELLDRVRTLGMQVHAAQLPSNRREICVVARKTAARAA